MNNRFLIILTAGLLMQLSACTTMEKIGIQSGSVKEKLDQSVEVGDTVKITKYSGDSIQFTVTDISMEYVIGSEHKVHFGDIKQIKKEVVSFRKTAGLIVGVPALIWSLAILDWIGP